MSAPTFKLQTQPTHNMIIILIGCYFFPIFIAAFRSHPNSGAVFIVNLFLGWTFLGWVISLAMACSSIRREVRQIEVRLIAQQPIPLALAKPVSVPVIENHITATDKLYDLSHPAPPKTHWEKVDSSDDELCKWAT
jgi:T4 superinfection immunity protein